MTSPDSRIVERLESAVREIESESSAEIVVSLARVSGRYGDVDLLCGGLCGLAVLGIILWSRWSFHPDYVLLNVIMGGLLGWVLSRKLLAVRRLLTTSARRQAQVENAARLEFLEAGVDQTRARTGILIYLSTLERRITLVPDREVARQVGEQELSRWRTEFGERRDQDGLLEALAALLEAMKPALSRCLPRVADDRDELDNRVRIAPV